MASGVVYVKGRIMSALRRLVDALVDGAFRVANLRKSPRLPPIRESLLQQSAVTLAARIGRGEVKSVDVVRAFISRIREVDPFLNAVVDQRFEDALLEAQTVDSLVEATPVADRPALVERQPFLGVPFTTKDLVGIKGLLLDVGVPGRRGVRADEDAAAVAALRRAGGLPLALTNVSEMAMWWESYNKLHGRTRNPYDLRRIPGGSSGKYTLLRCVIESLPQLIHQDSSQGRCLKNGHIFFEIKRTDIRLREQATTVESTTSAEEHVLFSLEPSSSLGFSDSTQDCLKHCLERRDWNMLITPKKERSA